MASQMAAVNSLKPQTPRPASVHRNPGGDNAWPLVCRPARVKLPHHVQNPVLEGYFQAEVNHLGFPDGQARETGLLQSLDEAPSWVRGTHSLSLTLPPYAQRPWAPRCHRGSHCGVLSQGPRASGPFAAPAHPLLALYASQNSLPRSPNCLILLSSLASLSTSLFVTSSPKPPLTFYLFVFICPHQVLVASCGI